MPAHVDAVLKSRATFAGVSLSVNFRGDLTHAASRPTVDELSARIAARGAVALGEPSEVIIRRLRDAGE
jgi:hypothetical protein